MSSKPLGPIRRTWYRWKALKLPWRKRFLVGLDLNGNTFWEFRDALGNPNSSRMRRIIQFQGAGATRGAGSTPFSEVTSQISPAWHQWLRHTREYPPSLTEQSQDLVRQAELKILAKQADERWAAKKRVTDTPHEKQYLPAFNTGSNVGREAQGIQALEVDMNVAHRAPASQVSLEDMKEPVGELRAKVANEKSQGQVSQVDDGRRGMRPKIYKDDPWKKAGSGPSENWQPMAWKPDPATLRR